MAVDPAKNRRNTDRRSGISAAWAIIMTNDRRELRCWVIDESKQGAGLETREQMIPCPLNVGETYWMLLKPSTSKRASWVAAAIRHVHEKGKSSGIYKIGIRIATTPPPGLGDAPSIV